MWNILNDVMGRKSKSTPSFLESEGHFITKPLDIADYLNNYFNDKVNKLRVEMSQTNGTQSFALIRNRIMAGLSLKFTKVTVSLLKKLLLGYNDKPAAVDNMDMKLLKLVANLIAIPIWRVEPEFREMYFSSGLENQKDHFITWE